MGANQSKEELLYQAARVGNHDLVKALRNREGASLEVLKYQNYQFLNYSEIDFFGIDIFRLILPSVLLQWIDKEGRTPLLLACSRPELLDMAITLLNLGANMNAYRSGSNSNS
jgi:ankyrin repeat protein